MILAESLPDKLLAECGSHGIRLLPASAGGLTIDAPQGVLTPALIARLKTHKAGLLHLMQPMQAAPERNRLETPDPANVTCDRCGSMRFRDTPIHGGQSIRQDCAACGRTAGFPEWNMPEQLK